MVVTRRGTREPPPQLVPTVNVRDLKQNRSPHVCAIQGVQTVKVA